MTLKSILVHVTNSEQSKARVDTALDLAMAHDAHLTGIAVRPDVQIPTYAASNIPESVFREVEERQDAADLAAFPQHPPNRLRCHSACRVGRRRSRADDTSCCERGT